MTLSYCCILQVVLIIMQKYILGVSSERFLIFVLEKCIIEEKEFVTTGSNNIIPPSCTQSCKCPLTGGTRTCLSLCPPKITLCGDEEELVEYDENVSDSKCTCPVQGCLKYGGR